MNNRETEYGKNSRKNNTTGFEWIKDTKSIMNVTRFLTVLLSAFLLGYCVIAGKGTDGPLWMAGVILLVISSVLSIAERHMKRS